MKHFPEFPAEPISYLTFMAGLGRKGKLSADLVLTLMPLLETGSVSAAVKQYPRVT